MIQNEAGLDATSHSRQARSPRSWASPAGEERGVSSQLMGRFSGPAQQRGRGGAPPAPRGGCLWPCSEPCVCRRTCILPDTASPGVSISRETPKRQTRERNPTLGRSVHPEPEMIFLNSLPSPARALDPVPAAGASAGLGNATDRRFGPHP